MSELQLQMIKFPKSKLVRLFAMTFIAMCLICLALAMEAESLLYDMAAAGMKRFVPAVLTFEFYPRKNVSRIKLQRNYCAFTNQKNAGRTMQGVTINHKPSFLNPVNK
jgi:hypothetical protein